MAVYKPGKIWWYKFNWNGEAVRESTKQSNKRIAEQMEATHKTSLAKGEVGYVIGGQRQPSESLQRATSYRSSALRSQRSRRR